MTKDEWEKDAAALAAKQAKLQEPSIDQMRRSLVQIDKLMKGAPTPILKRYKDVGEAELRDLSDQAQTRLDAGSSKWLDGDHVRAAGAQARALDRHLHQHRVTRGKPDDPMFDFLCRESGVHVIPRPQAVEPDVCDVTTRTYRRRGLLRHRLLPAITSDGYTVALEWHRDLSVRIRLPDAQVVGALFDALSLEPDPAFVKFVAKDAPCADEDATLTAHVDAAFTPGTIMAVWPELTMPLGRRDKLSAALKARSGKSPLGTGPAFAVAGSWHEVDGDVVRNRMHVLSRSGKRRFYHDKSLPLESATLGEEELEPSYRVSVLICEDALVAFAICRDFCEAQIAQIYRELDVDLVVVPSYGDAKTIWAHRQQALNLSTDPGTRTFVVQQIVPNQVAPAGQGYVLPPMADLAACDTETLRAAAPSVRHPIAFKKV